MTRDQAAYVRLAAARSFLFVPATRPERIDKAMRSGTDCVIVDLEDAVGEADKVAARTAFGAWLAAHPGQQLLVRINAVDTDWHDDDLALCRHPGIVGVVLPKAESTEVIARTHEISGKWVLPIIETPLGIEDCATLAKASGVARLLFGKLDLALLLHLTLDEADPEEFVFLPYRARLVTASALAGLPPPVDGVFSRLDDDSDDRALRRYVSRARAHGFGALLLIHPNQVAVAHAVFAPSPAERAWANQVLLAVAESRGGVVTVDGQMVDAPVIALARRIAES